MFTLGVPFRGATATAPPLFYDWEPAGTELVFSATAPDTYFPFAGLGRGGSYAGILLCNGGPQVFQATLPHTVQHYDIWFMMTNGGIIVSFYNGATPVEVIISQLFGPLSYTEYTGVAAGPFDTIRMTLSGGLPALYMDDWTFS